MSWHTIFSALQCEHVIKNKLGYSRERSKTHFVLHMAPVERFHNLLFVSFYCTQETWLLELPLLVCAIAYTKDNYENDNIKVKIPLMHFSEFCHLILMLLMAVQGKIWCNIMETSVIQGIASQSKKKNLFISHLKLIKVKHPNLCTEQYHPKNICWKYSNVWDKIFK